MRPDRLINKALLSSTSQFVGQYEQDGLLLTHAWQDLGGWNESGRSVTAQTSRSAFMLVFKSQPPDESAGYRLPDDAFVPATISCYLSVLFGKRFENHGLTESAGLFRLPNLESIVIRCRDTLPHNSRQPRVDFSVPLNLSELGRIRPLFTQSGASQAFLKIFQTSAKFYSQALQAFETDPEVAYLHLVTAMETLSSFYVELSDELYDPLARTYLSRIEGELPDGDKVARYFRSHMLSIRRRFVETIVRLVDDDFFGRSECSATYGRFRPESFRKCMGAAYDLRSKYVHTGARFGYWAAQVLGATNNEVQVGSPVVADRDYGKILANAPTLVGLERVVRYCILAIAGEKKLYSESADESS